MKKIENKSFSIEWLTKHKYNSKRELINSRKYDDNNHNRNKYVENCRHWCGAKMIGIIKIYKKKIFLSKKNRLKKRIVLFVTQMIHRVRKKYLNALWVIYPNILYSNCRNNSTNWNLYIFLLLTNGHPVYTHTCFPDTYTYICIH